MRLPWAGRVRFSRSAVTEASANAVVARSQDIIDAATEHLASLASHGVTQAKLTALKQRLKSYDALRVLPHRRARRPQRPPANWRS